MKKIALYITAISLAATVSTSCSDVLDIDPTDRYSEAVIWGDKAALDKYVASFYAQLAENSELMDHNINKYNDCFTDLMKSNSYDQYNHTYNKVLTMPSAFNSDSAGAFECWGDNYTRIRRVNEFLRDSPEYVSKFGEEFINSRTGEALFIRAFAYFELVRVYGGVVLRLSVDGPDQNDIARSTEAECYDQIIKDLKQAAEYLPTSWPDERGRITKQATYGFLARVALFAKQYDLAVEAANECAANGGALASTYASVFANPASAENLLCVEFHYKNYNHRGDYFFRPIYDGVVAGGKTMFGAITPTSEFVDQFEMKDGTPFSWDEFEKKLAADPYADPYADRDPRFYASILYNTAKWEGRRIETFVDGNDGIKPYTGVGASGATCTGYYLRKFITENESNWSIYGCSHFFPLVRYSEVLLNKAEALAMADWSANKADAIAALKEVRDRVSLPTSDFATLEAFMAAIRHERVVELGGEGQRFWDLRRWKIANMNTFSDRLKDADGSDIPSVIDGQMAHGVRISRDRKQTAGADTEDDPTDDVFDDKYSYEHINVDADKPRIFYDQYYLFAIPLGERNNNALCKDNNPGWN